MTSDILATDNMRVRRFGALIVNVNGPRPITDEMWNPYLAWLEKFGEPRINTTFTFAPLQNPNALQRKRLLALPNLERILKPKRVALMTNSALVRSAMTALNW